MNKNITTAYEDAYLVSGIQKGDQHSLSKLYDKYAPAINGIICKIVTDEAIAEDVLQKTFQITWNKIRTAAFPKISLFTFLLQIARPLAIDSVVWQPPQNPVADNSVYAAADADVVQNGFSTTYQKPIFDLLYFRGLCCEEVATRLKIPVETVKMQFRLSIKNMSIVKVL